LVSEFVLIGFNLRKTVQEISNIRKARICSANFFCMIFLILEYEVIFKMAAFQNRDVPRSSNIRPLI
jgi:hypothetical protein